MKQPTKPEDYRMNVDDYPTEYDPRDERGGNALGWAVLFCLVVLCFGAGVLIARWQLGPLQP